MSHLAYPPQPYMYLYGQSHCQAFSITARLNAISISASTEASLLILDGNVTAGRTLVLATDSVRDLLILGLLHGGLVALIALSETVLLHCVNA